MPFIITGNGDQHIFVPSTPATHKCHKGNNEIFAGGESVEHAMRQFAESPYDNGYIVEVATGKKVAILTDGNWEEVKAD